VSGWFLTPYKETVFCIGGVLRGGGFVQGVGWKKHGLLLALALLLLTPFLTTSTYSILDEYKMTASNSMAAFTPAQLEEGERIVIQNDADFVSYDFPGNGTESNPFVIEGLNISSLEESCIIISNVIVSFVVRNCTLRNEQTYFPVIRLFSVHNSSIEENIIIGGSEGILGVQARNLGIRGNTICDSFNGLKFVNSLNITAEDNSVYANSIGVELVSTSESVFSSNRIYANHRRGFSIDETSNFINFTANIVGWNEIAASYSRSAVDEGSNNTWLGNWWSDYEPPGSYNISGSSESQDAMPIQLFDAQAPRLNAPLDIIMGQGSDVTVRWTPRDAYPFRYAFYLDAVIIESGVWIDDAFIFDLQHLEPGDYNLILSVSDGSGNITEDTVFASVLFVILGDIGTELVAYASALTVGIFLAVLWLLKRRP
jgi:parallel beta-helix repeat protein